MQQDNRFKEYQQHQTTLFPPNPDDLLPQQHPARVISQIVDQVDIHALTKAYPGGGASAYHPRMLLKVLVLAYVSNIYSSRAIAAACQEHLAFMWISANARPDHNTINRFRSDRLKKIFKEIFTQIVILLAEKGVLSLSKEVFVDGTKIEANANRYTFVWAKGIKTQKEKLKKQLDELWAYAEEVAKEELKAAPPPSIEQIKAEELAQTIQAINEALKDKEIDKRVKQKLKKAEKEWPARIEKYNKQEEILDGRGSYSKTDTDATFMRTKEDHLKNGQLKPSYNYQIATHNQYIVEYSIDQSPNDVNTLSTTIKNYQASYDLLPKMVVADAGYSSEENYHYLEQKEVKACIKDPRYEQEKKKSWQAKHPFDVRTLHYNQEEDVYYCPMGQKMEFKGEEQRVSKTGYQSKSKKYEATNCGTCPLRGPCHKSQGNRVIRVNGQLNKYKAETRELLKSEEGWKVYKRRGSEVETVFGNIKENMKCRRLLLRGKEKVETEMGLVSLCHNLRKYIKEEQKSTRKEQKLAA